MFYTSGLDWDSLTVIDWARTRGHSGAFFHRTNFCHLPTTLPREHAEIHLGKNSKQAHRKLKDCNSHTTPPLCWQPDLNKLLGTLRGGWNHTDYEESLREINSWFLVMLVEKGLQRIENMWKWYWPLGQSITIEPFNFQYSKCSVYYWISVYYNK